MSTSNSILLCGVHNFSTEISNELQEGLIIQLVPIFLTKLKSSLEKGHCEWIWLFYASFAVIAGKWNFVGLETNFMEAGGLFSTQISDAVELSLAVPLIQKESHSKMNLSTVTFERKH